MGRASCRSIRQPCCAQELPPQGTRLVERNRSFQRADGVRKVTSGKQNLAEVQMRLDARRIDVKCAAKALACQLPIALACRDDAARVEQSRFMRMSGQKGIADLSGGTEVARPKRLRKRICIEAHPEHAPARKCTNHHSSA